VPGKAAPKLDVAFSRGRRLEEITAAGGFVVEVDIFEIKGSAAAICIASSEFEKQGIAVVVQADDSADKDKLYVNGRAFEIDADCQVGQKVRLEVDTRDFDKGTQGEISVCFGDTTVISDQKFRWEKSPLGFYLAAVGGRAVFDNLVIGPAQPTIEFAKSASSGSERESPVLIDVLLEHPIAGQEYSVDYTVSSTTAQGSAVDYALKNGSLTFLPGETKKTITLTITNDEVNEYDETIQLMLANPTGSGVRLSSKTTHSYTIVGEWPVVQFEKAGVAAREGSGDTQIGVVLSHPCEDTVTVSYNLVQASAQKGTDYEASAGTLAFERGQTSRHIRVRVLDDAESENAVNETFMLRLSASKNCIVGPRSSLTFEIIDDEPGIEFDGCTWLPSSFSKHTMHKGKPLLCINPQGHLEWVPLYGDLLLVKLPEMPVEKPGQVATFGWLYKGCGNATGSYVENIRERYGSGDLRMSVLDSSGKPFATDRGYGRGNEIFCGYKGYQARLSPHVPTDTRADKWAKRTDPYGDNCGSPVDWGGCWAYPEYYNGHGAPVGEFSPLIFSVRRTAEKIMEFSVELGGVKHTYVDDMSTDEVDPSKRMESLYGEGSFHVRELKDTQPRNIDTLAIYFANQRPFELITFAPLK
jgi:hypothetical protein